MSDNKTVLIVEDEHTLLEMYRIKFSDSGFNFFGASTGEEGLKLAQENRTDLVLVDLMLENKAEGGIIDGYEVIKRLRSNEKTKDVKICALTNFDQDQNIKQAYEVGANDYLVKSDLTPGELVEKVKSILDGKKVGRSPENF